MSGDEVGFVVKLDVVVISGLYCFMKMIVIKSLFVISVIMVGFYNVGDMVYYNGKVMING